MLDEQTEATLIADVAAIKQDNKNIHKRITDIMTISQNVQELALSVRDIANETKELRTDYGNINDRLADLENKPTKTWETIKSTIITATASGVVGFLIGILSQIIMKGSA